MQLTRLLMLYLLATAFSASANTEQPLTKIVLPPVEKSSEKTGSFFPRVLEMAMEKTLQTHGPYQITSYSHHLTHSRFLSEVERNGVINLMWAMTNESREKKLSAVKISLLKELNSHRVFLIRKSDQKKFQNIRTLDDLRQLRAGQGKSWPDTDVLIHNQIPVVTSAHYELLFDMLAANRFDYFPRGLYEIWDEYKIHEDRDLVIEETLMLYYEGPIYFFTSKQNKSLAERVETGLKLAIADGSFDALFYSYSGFRRGEAELQEHNRRKFDLDYPDQQ